MGVPTDIESERLLVPAARSRLLWRVAPGDAGRRIKLFGLNIENTSVAETGATWIAAARAGKKLRAVFANAHVVNELTADSGYRAVVTTADRVYADGSGMAVAALLAGQPLQDNVNGTDLFPRLAADAAAAGIKIFLLGGRHGVAAQAQQRMNDFGLGAGIAGIHHGFFAAGSTEEAAAIAAVNASGADIVLVAMGVPLQDKWIARNAARLNAPVLVGVGGLFDFFAGTVSRAPHAMRVIGCEWVWRLVLEPRRMARRYLIGNARFLVLAVAAALHVRRRKARAAQWQAVRGR